MPVAGRALVGAAIIILKLTSLMPGPRADADITSLVVGEEELVSFTTTSSPNRDRGAVYVFYPGLTIEADNEIEPAPTEALCSYGSLIPAPGGRVVQRGAAP